MKKGSPYAEIEVMKVMPLKVEETGIITWRSNEGAALGAGDLLASLELDNPDNVETFTDEPDVEGWIKVGSVLNFTTAPYVPWRRRKVAVVRSRIFGN